MSSAIRVEHLTKSFGGFAAVSDVTFEAPEGGITALLGPSGSGKSTVLRILAGLEPPDAGRLWIGGEELTTSAIEERRVGFVFQHYALFRHMTVRRNIAFGLAVRKVPKEQQRERVDELLRLVHLDGFGDRYPGQLSGGQRQRVALARALAPRPQVLLLDEPFGALDARVRRDLRAWLHGIHAELGITSLLVTHDQEEALELANELIVMNEGRIEQVGPAASVYSSPATPFVAGFVGSANVIRGVVVGGRVQYGESFTGGAAHLEDGSAALAYIRPHDVGVSRQPLSAWSASGLVERVGAVGLVCKLQIRLSDLQVVIAELPRDRIEGVAEGDRVYVDLERARVFEPGGHSVSDELSAV
jgi:sulfate transport system ATP-binding protein